MDLHPGPEERSFTGGGVESNPILRALQENEDWYQDLVEHSQDLLCIHDLTGRLLMVNPGPARVLGYGVEELLQIPLREVIAPEFRPQFDEYLRHIESTGEASGYMVVMTSSGERRIWHYHNTLRTEGVVSPIVRGIAHDGRVARTQQRQAQVAETFFGADRGDDLRFGIERDAVPILVLDRHFLAQPGDPVAHAVAVVARIERGFLKLIDDAFGCRVGGIAHAQVDDVDPGHALLMLHLVDPPKQIRRQALNPRGDVDLERLLTHSRDCSTG